MHPGHTLDTAHLTLIVTRGVLILTGFAYLVISLQDVPVRAFLRSKLGGGGLSRTQS